MKKKISLTLQLSSLFVFLLCSCLNTHNSSEKQDILYFEVAGISLHTHMPKDSVILLLGSPQNMQSLLENGIIKEELQYVIPKSKENVERIKKLNNALKVGMLELDIYRSLLSSLTNQLSLKLENGVLKGYSIN